MGRGIVYIAFGEEYDRLASHTVILSKKNTRLPITVITNLKERNSKWDECRDINFVYLDAPTDSNRDIKTQLYKYTPYDETLYIDCDSVIWKPGIEGVFPLLAKHDVLLQRFYSWTEGRKYYRLYRDSLKSLEIQLPVTIYIGGFWAFRKNESSIKFFDLWNQYWKRFGSGRDMPALACAVKNSEIKHFDASPNDYKFFSFGINKDMIVVHRVNSDDLLKHFGIPRYKQNKPFDQGTKGAWKMIHYDEVCA